MKKQITFEKYNAAEIVKLYEDGSIGVILIEETTDEDGNTTELERVQGVSFDAGSWPFELTVDEINELKPVVYVEETP